MPFLWTTSFGADRKTVSKGRGMANFPCSPEGN